MVGPLSDGAGVVALPDLWRGPLSLPADMPVRQAREALRHSGQRCALVVRSGERIGVITPEELAAAPTSETVGDCLEWEILRIPAGADAAETLRRHQRAAWRWLLRPRASRESVTSA